MSSLSLIVVEGDVGTSLDTIDRQFDFGLSDIIGTNGFFLLGNQNVLSAN